MVATQFLGVFILSSIVLIESQVCPGTNTWECRNGTCIWYDDRCDGKVHCDGSDEENCADWECSSTRWKCENDKCIWRPDRCSGLDDCQDGSDERNCENWTCGENRWKCSGDGLCIRVDDRCDGVDTCADGSDEQHCDTVLESLTLDGHNDTITVNGDDHRTLYLTCRASGRVKSFVFVKKENDVFGDVTFSVYEMQYRRVGTYTYDAVLTLKDVTCHDMGRYTCAFGQTTGSQSVQLNVICEGMKYGGNLACPSAWEIGQSVKLTLTIDRSIWPSICRRDRRRREAWFAVTRWNDTGRQSIECTVYNITLPGQCQGAFTPGTLGCGCVSKTDEHFTLEFNFVMNVSSFGNWSVDTHCLRTDLSKPIKFHVAPECNVRPEPPLSIIPSTSHGGAGGPLTIPRGQTNVTLTCGIEGRTTGVCWCFCPTTSPDLVQKQHPELIFKSNSSLCRPDELWIYCHTNASQSRSVDSPFVTTYNPTTKRTQLVINETSDLLDGSYRCAFGHKTLTGNISQVSTKFIVAVTGCENKTYGARCQESCGQCANNETCDASTGHCPACPEGLLPPLCKQEKQAAEPFTTGQKIAIGVGAGASASGVAFAWLFQGWQILNNLGWMPVFLGGNNKKQEKEEDDEKYDEESEDDGHDGELSICCHCLICLACGGCGLCVTRRKKKSKRKRRVVVKDEHLLSEPAIVAPTKTVAPANPNMEQSYESDLGSHSVSMDEVPISIPKQTTDRKQFTDRYFHTTSWLADPIAHQQKKLANWHTLYSKSNVDIDKMSSKERKTSGKTRQDSNMSLQQSGSSLHQSGSSLQQSGSSLV